MFKFDGTHQQPPSLCRSKGQMQNILCILLRLFIFAWGPLLHILSTLICVFVCYQPSVSGGQKFAPSRFQSVSDHVLTKGLLLCQLVHFSDWFDQLTAHTCCCMRLAQEVKLFRCYIAEHQRDFLHQASPTVVNCVSEWKGSACSVWKKKRM